MLPFVLCDEMWALSLLCVRVRFLIDLPAKEQGALRGTMQPLAPSSTEQPYSPGNLIAYTIFRQLKRVLRQKGAIIWLMVFRIGIQRILS